MFYYFSDIFIHFMKFSLFLIEQLLSCLNVQDTHLKQARENSRNNQ